MIWLVGVVTEAAFIVLLAHRRTYRLLPAFFLYTVWALASDLVMYFFRTRLPAHYFNIYLVEASLDSTLQYLVLVELAWSVLRPHRESLPRGIVLKISLVVVGLALAAWPMTALQGVAASSPRFYFLARLAQTFAVLRILYFLALAAGSHLLSLSWRDRELQVATGLGIYSIASLAASILHTHQKFGPQYQLVDQIVAISYLCSLGYWLASFAQKDAPRREFSPAMGRILLAVAGSAHTQRAGLDDLTAPREKQG
jgi:hypothetical protein